MLAKHDARWPDEKWNCDSVGFTCLYPMAIKNNSQACNHVHMDVIPLFVRWENYKPPLLKPLWPLGLCSANKRAL